MEQEERESKSLWSRDWTAARLWQRRARNWEMRWVISVTSSKLVLGQTHQANNLGNLDLSLITMAVENRDTDMMMWSCWNHRGYPGSQERCVIDQHRPGWKGTVAVEQFLCSQVSVGRKKADDNSAPKDVPYTARVHSWNKRTLRD